MKTILNKILTFASFLALFLLPILLIGTISAQISISPSSININSFPGETHSINLTITSDGRYAVFFNSTNKDISITPYYIVTNGNLQNETINLTFARDISKGTFNFDILGSSEVIEVQVPSSSSGGGGGGGSRIIYRDRNNTIYVPQNCTDCPNPKNETEIPKEIEKKTSWWIYVLLILLSFFAFFARQITEKIISFKKRNMPKGDERRFRENGFKKETFE